MAACSDSPSGEKVSYTLTINAAGSGNGRITGSGIDCTISNGVASGTCSATLPAGSQVSLIAVAAAGGDTFSGWNGPCSGTAACSLMLKASQTVSATFAAPVFPLAITGSGTGSGRVTGPGGIDCNITDGRALGSCTVSFTRGTEVTLFATGTGGDPHTWSGACTGASGCSVTMNEGKQVDARFTIAIYQISVAGVGDGDGIISGPAGIQCNVVNAVGSGTCSAAFARGTSVTLTANADAGAGFSGWISGGSVQAAAETYTFSAADSRELLALFVKNRMLSDRPDDAAGPQVHVIYVLPFDAADRRLDVNGTLQTSVASFRNWFVAATNGLDIRFDTYNGALDVSFFRLQQREAEIVGSHIVYLIENALRAAGKLQPHKRYLAYYDGDHLTVCGGAHWPPRIPGQTAAMYVRSCSPQFVTSPTAFPSYWEFAALHDLLHTLGIVSEQAPHHDAVRYAHVPEQHDLMYSGGSGAWLIGPNLLVDVNSDDYYGSYVPPGVLKITDSPFIVQLGAMAAARARLQLERPAQTTPIDLRVFPLHSPFPR